MLQVPDNWTLMKVTDGYKIAAGWSGGYLDGDAWRLSSGVTTVEDEGKSWLVGNISGTAYRLFKGGERLSMAYSHIVTKLKDAGASVVLMEEYYEGKDN